MDGKAQRGDRRINGQTVKEGRGHMSNQRRMEREVVEECGLRLRPLMLFCLIGEYIFNTM